MTRIGLRRPNARRACERLARMGLAFGLFVALATSSQAGMSPSEDLRAQGVSLVNIAITRAGQGASAPQIATELRAIVDAEPGGFVSDPEQAIALVLRHALIDASDIAIALRDAFGASRSDTTRMLKSAGVSAFDVARALRDVFGADATLAAQELESRATHRLETATALRDVFGLGDASAAQVLLAIGAGPVDIARALRTGFGSDAARTHALLTGPAIGFDAEAIADSLAAGLVFFENPANFLKYAGFYYLDIIAGLTAHGIADKTAFGYVAAEFLAEKNAQDGPVVYFHSEEQYLPSSAGWYMDRTVLWSSPDPADEGRRDCTSCTSTLTTLDELQDEVARRKAIDHVVFWMDRVERFAALGTAKAYVHVLRLEQVTDIQYWFFYPYNGPGTVKCRLGELWEDQAETPPMGEHVGDWESVNLRYRNDTNALESVMMSSHGDYHRYAMFELEFENGHVVVTPSLNGHANYSPVIDGSQHERKVHYDLLIAHLDIDLMNRIDKLGPRWTAREDVELMAVNGDTLYGKEWWEYEGRWARTSTVS